MAKRKKTKKRKKASPVTKSEAARAAKKLALYSAQQGKLLTKKARVHGSSLALKAKKKSLEIGKKGIAAFKNKFLK